MSTKQKIIVGFIALLALFVVLLLWKRSPTTPTVPTGPSASAQAPAASATVPKSAERGATSAAQAGPFSLAQPSATQKPSLELKRTFATLNHNPIEFYGRALDQYGEPVSGAAVSGTILYNTGTKSGTSKASTVTDAQGYFQFTQLEGQDIGIGIAKKGYEYRRKNSSFSFSYFEADHKRHIPDSKNPVIFTLWKKQGAESLINYHMDRDIPADGTPIRINLATGKIDEQNADLIVTLSRTPLRMRYGERGYVWNAAIEVVDGGLIRAGEQDYYNLAPESGYEPRFDHVQEAQNLRDAQAEKIKWTWHGEFKETFFVKAKNGQRYARVVISVFASGRNTNDTIGGLGLGVWLNPSGSRNLEFDPAKAITPPR